MTTIPTSHHDLAQITADGVLRYHHHPGQWKLWESNRRFLLALAGVQSGKTAFGPGWLYREIQRRGPGDYIVVTPTYPLLNLKALPEFIRLFETWLGLGHYHPAGRQFVFSDDGSRRTFGQFDPVRDPQTRILFGYATDSESLESATAKAAWLDEAGQDRFKLESWEAVLARLSLSEGRVLLTTTIYNLGWLKQQLYDPWLAGDPDIEISQFESIMNPNFPRSEWERARRTLPAWKFNMRYRAQFTRPAGMIYDCLNEQDIIPRFSIPPEWRRYLGMDFGGVNTAGVFFAEEPVSGRLFAYREYKAGSRSAGEHASHLLDGEPMVPVCVGGSKSEGQWRQEFALGGLPIMPPSVSDVEVGIDRVYGLMKGRKLLWFSDLVGTLDQLGSYSRELDANGEPTEKIADKETFHYCFVADTMVRTLHGDVPIQDVRVGDMALTRQGYKPVIAKSIRHDRPLRRVSCSDGRTLTGTPDHPIFSATHARFAKLDTMRYGDILVTIDYVSQESRPCAVRPANLWELLTTVIPMQLAQAIGYISNMLAATCTVIFGSIAMALSLSGMTFITSMAIQAITIYRTFNYSQGVSTSSYTQEKPRPQQSNWPTWKQYVRSRQSGTLRQKAISGIANTPKIRCQRAGRHLISASSVVNLLNQGIAALCDFARMLARQPIAEIAELMTSNERARNVLRHSRSTTIRNKNTAPVSVHSLQDAGIGTVYNLTVADAHEYFANGILVSNCDAVRYIIGYIATGAVSDEELERFGSGAAVVTPTSPQWANLDPDMLAYAKGSGIVVPSAPVVEVMPESMAQPLPETDDAGLELAMKVAKFTRRPGMRLVEPSEQK